MEYQSEDILLGGHPRLSNVWSPIYSTTTPTKTTNTSKRLKKPKEFYRCILFALSLAAVATNTLAAPTTAAPIATSTTTTTTLPAETLPTNAASTSIAPITTTTRLHYTVASPSATHARPRKPRHSKRHSNWQDYLNFNENTTALEWANPCGGFYMPTDVALGTVVGLMKRKHPKQIYNILKKSANNEHKTLSSQQDIDISNIQIWFLHNYTYKFLPKLKENSSIALKRWYRNMQTYVASFAYLRRVQLKWDHSKSQRESRVARELKHLMASSRRMLCELESAVNNTHPYQRTLPQITRPQMDKRLKLRTKRRAERTAAGAVHEADPIDLQFVKYYYFEYLETMWKVLRKITKRKGQVAIGVQQQQQKEFNEVEKPSESVSGSSSSTTGTLSVVSDGGQVTNTRRTAAKQHKQKNPRNRKQNKNKNKMARRRAEAQLKTQT